jgi:flagellar protein FlgJ
MEPNSAAMLTHANALYGANKANLANISKTDMKRIEETAKEFESVFIAEMLRPMFEGIETDGMFGGGPGEKIYRDMQIDEYGKSLSGVGGIGLADHVMREMIKMQEGR